MCFEDYNGPTEYKPLIKFIEKKFKDVIDVTTGKPPDIYTHVTCATDTSVRAEFEAVKKFVIQKTFKEMGLN